MDDFSDEADSASHENQGDMSGDSGRSISDEAAGQDDNRLSPAESFLPEQPSVLRGTDSPSPERAFEDLTLAELLGRFFRRPLATAQAVIDISSISHHVTNVADHAEPAQTDLHRRPSDLSADAGIHFSRQGLQLGLQVCAFLLSVWGCSIWAANDISHSKDIQLGAGLPYVVLGIMTWLVSEIIGNWPVIRQRWRSRTVPLREAGTAVRPRVDGAQTQIATVRERWMVPEKTDRLRIIAASGAGLLGYITWQNTADNQFTFLGLSSWLWSIVLVLVAFAPDTWTLPNLRRALQARRTSIHLRGNWTQAAILMIMMLGAYFRLVDLDGMPPQMTSDHKEKLLDAQAVLDGDYQVFFPNNGGREGFQMYALALISHVPGLGINHFSLKVLAAIESLITLPVLWWMGREVMGERDRRLGNSVGLIVMALVAVSYWHLAITRVALRIILTPLFAALLLIFLTRAMRHNRRGDFILAGLVLGVSLYAYQAARMLPLVVVAGIGMMMLRHVRHRQIFRCYLQNLIALVLVSFVVFIPLFRFSQDNPEIFWMRANGRILGTPVIEEVDTSGEVVMRDATLQERVDALEENLTILADNIRRALLMYNWQGDEAWFHGIPHHPVMDIFTGGLLVVGVGAWLVLILRYRDPIHMLIPVMVFVMLLPSALSIGRPSENPSATRSSGSLPPVYLLAALPLALTSNRIRQATAGRTTGLAVSVGVTTVVVMSAFAANADLYFVDYRDVYRHSTWPYSEPGRMLHGFAISDGSYGNAFMISYSYWWDYTIVGMEAGILDWPNGINTELVATEDFVRDAFACAGRKYPVDPDRDLLFFFHYLDDDSEAKLREWFPQGHTTLIESYQESYNYKIYRVPALGIDGFQDFIRNYSAPPTCTLREF